MAEFRQVHCKTWRDDWFSELDTDSKLLWLYLITNQATSVSGIYQLPRKFIAFETGLTVKRIDEIMKRFKHDGKIDFDESVIWICNMREYQASGSPKVATRIALDFDTVPNCRVKGIYAQKYGIDMVSIPILKSDPDTDTDTDTETETDHADKPRRASKPKAERQSDELFDAIAKVTCTDPVTAGASIGKVKAVLVKASPPYTASEVLKFGSDWPTWKDKPPTLWQLKEQIGIVRNGNGNGQHDDSAESIKGYTVYR